MKKSVITILFMLLTLSLFYPINAVTAKTLRMGLLVSNKALAYRAAEKLAHHVEEATNGEYKIKLFPSQQLGSGKEMMQMLRMGTLDLYQGTNTQPTQLKEGRNFNTTSSPYCFQSQEEFIKFMDTPLFGEMAQQLAVSGIKLMGYMGSRSPKAITTNDTPVKTPEDLKGLKLRLPGSPAVIAYFKAVGASPTPMPFSEFFTAAKTGVVEGQDNGIEVVYPRGLWEVQKYYMKTDHNLGAWMLFCGEKKFQKWPESLQKAMQEGLKIAAAYGDEELAKFMDEAFVKVQEKGMTVIDIDKKPFIAAAEQVWKDLDGDIWDKGFMDKVQKQLAEIRK